MRNVLFFCTGNSARSILAEAILNSEGADCYRAFSAVIRPRGAVHTIRGRRAWVAPAVDLYITAAYWFTSSTSFADPAITVARSLPNTFAGIAPHDVPLFIVAQLLGAGCSALLSRW